MVSGLYDIVLARNDRGRLELVAAVHHEGEEVPNQVIWHICRDPGGDWTTTWESLGEPPGGGVSRLAVEANIDGRFEVVVVGADKAVWHTWQTAAGDWRRGWHSLGKPGERSLFQASPALIRNHNHDGRLELFMQGHDAVLRHRWQRYAGGGPWVPWQSLGHPGEEVAIDARPALARNQDGRLELFALGTDGSVWHLWQREPGGGPWKPWHSLGKPDGQVEFVVGRPTVALRKDGCLELFMTTEDGVVWHCRQQRPAQGPWGSWKSLGSAEHPFAEVAVGAHADGRLALFACGSDELWQREQTDLDKPDVWSEWRSFSAPSARGITCPSVALNAEGRLELWLLIWGTTHLYHVEQTTPNGREWNKNRKRFFLPGTSPEPAP
jgi:hypothetical protein